jgi:hypothetical protein
VIPSVTTGPTVAQTVPATTCREANSCKFRGLISTLEPVRGWTERAATEETAARTLVKRVAKRIVSGLMKVELVSVARGVRGR